MTWIGATALLLGICYAASIGGVATPIGTPTNLIAINWLQAEMGGNIGFPQWMAFGVPAAALLVPAAWWILTRTLPKFSGGQDVLDRVRTDKIALGRMTQPEMRAAIVFGFVALLWVSRLWLVDLLDTMGWGTLAGFGGAEVDMMIAMAGAVVMFLVPAGGGEKRMLLNWEEADESIFLQPLDNILKTGKTRADRMLDLYHGPWAGDITRVYTDSAY